MQSKIKELLEAGQSIWLDNISRSMIESGALRGWISQGLMGLTSNPTIFDQAISTGPDYDKAIATLKLRGRSTFEIYDYLSITDVQDAADLFLPVYEQTKGWDGFVSLEIDPRLAHDIEASIAEGRRLFKCVNRPNLMIKVPATQAGFVVIERLLSEAINVNATLIFSLWQYEQAAQAALRGLAKLALKAPGLLANVHSVASVFISRLDTSVDPMIEKNETLKPLSGKAAVANAWLIYNKHLEIFSSRGFKQLKEKGACLQRIVWASTSTKNPSYPDIKYVTELMLESTVNTIPEKTLRAFVEHGEVKILSADRGQALRVIKALRDAGIDVDVICNKLLDDGVKAFEKSFQSLLSSIELKTRNLAGSTA
jgi:transaldolase